MSAPDSVGSLLAVLGEFPFPYLIVRVALGNQNIHDWELVDISVSLELLPYPRANGRDWQRDRVHRLNFTSLVKELCQSECHREADCRTPARGYIHLEATPGSWLALVSSHRSNWQLYAC